MKKSLKMTIMGIAAVLLCWIPNQASAANAGCIVLLTLGQRSYAMGMGVGQYHATGVYNEAVGYTDPGNPHVGGGLPMDDYGKENAVIQQITVACEVGGKGFPNMIILERDDADDMQGWWAEHPGMIFFRIYPAGAHDHITGVGAGAVATAPDGIYPHCNAINEIDPDAASCQTGRPHLMYWYDIGNHLGAGADIGGNQAWVDIDANGEYQDLGASYFTSQGGKGTYTGTTGWSSGPWYVNEDNIDLSWPEIESAKIWLPAHTLPSSGTDLTPVTNGISAIEAKLDNLPSGPAGPQGDAGSQGVQGKVGPAGANGTDAPCVECSDIADAAFALACKLLTLHQPTTLAEFRESVTTISNVSIVGSGNNICAPHDAAGACAANIDSQVQGIFDEKGL